MKFRPLIPLLIASLIASRVNAAESYPAPVPRATTDQGRSGAIAAVNSARFAAFTNRELILAGVVVGAITLLALWVSHNSHS